MENKEIKMPYEYPAKLHLPERIGKAYLRIDNYDSLGAAEGFSKEVIDDFWGTNGDLAFAYSYRTENSEGEMVGIQTIDNKLSVYGCNSDIEDIDEKTFVEILVNDAEALNDASISESMSRTAYDENTVRMLELKLPEEVVKQKEELNSCKKFKDEAVKNSSDSKLSKLKTMKLDDKSVTNKQEIRNNDNKDAEKASK